MTGQSRSSAEGETAASEADPDARTVVPLFRKAW
jgi:hypothetical protein